MYNLNEMEFCMPFWYDGIYGKYSVVEVVGWVCCVGGSRGFVKGGRIIKLLIIYMEGNYVKMRLFDFLLYAALNHNLKRFSHCCCLWLYILLIASYKR